VYLRCSATLGPARLHPSSTTFVDKRLTLKECRILMGKDCLLYDRSSAWLQCCAVDAVEKVIALSTQLTVYLFSRKRGTRYMFGKGHRMHGNAKPSLTLVTYRRGDVVDIKIDGSQHKGQPYKTFHGKTGTVFNVTKTSVGIQLVKAVKHRLIQKRFHAKIEHVRPSNSRKDFLERVIQNDLKRKEARAKGEKASVKRQPKAPKKAFTVTIDSKNPPEMVMPKAFEYLI